MMLLLRMTRDASGFNLNFRAFQLCEYPADLKEFFHINKTNTCNKYKCWTTHCRIGYIVDQSPELFRFTFHKGIKLTRKITVKGTLENENKSEKRKVDKALVLYMNTLTKLWNTRVPGELFIQQLLNVWSSAMIPDKKDFDVKFKRSWYLQVIGYLRNAAILSSSLSILSLSFNMKPMSNIFWEILHAVSLWSLNSNIQSLNVRIC